MDPELENLQAEIHKTRQYLSVLETAYEARVQLVKFGYTPYCGQGTPESAAKLDLRSLSLEPAIAQVLIARGNRPIRADELVEALKNGGLNSNAKNLANVVNTVLKKRPNVWARSKSSDGVRNMNKYSLTPTAYEELQAGNDYYTVREKLKS